MAKQTTDGNQEVESLRKPLAAAEKKLLAKEKPAALKQIQNLITEFEVSGKEIASCQKKAATDTNKASATTLDARAIKKYHTLLKEYPAYQRAHNVAGIEFRKPEHRVKANVSVHINYEFDQFLSWIYDSNKLKDTPFQVTPAKSDQEIYNKVIELLKEWKTVAVERLEKEEAFKHISNFKEIFDTEASIRNASDVKLHAALSISHSYRGVWAMSGDKFEPPSIFHPDQHQRLRSSLSYLLFSKDPTAVRIANVCFNPLFNIKGMGTSTICELIGWHDTDEPLINERVVASLHFLCGGLIELPKK